MADSIQKLLLLLLLKQTMGSLTLEKLANNTDGITFTGSKSNFSLASLTICLRFWVNVYSPCTFVEVGPSAEGKKNRFSPMARLGIEHVYSNTSTQLVTLLGQQDFFTAKWPQMQWNSLCLAYDQPAAHVILVSNGGIVKDYVDRDLVNVTNGTRTGLGVTVMKQMNGKLTDLNIWNGTVNSK